jgi:hypothetical protein
MLVHSEWVNGLGKLTEATRFRQAQAGDWDALNGLREPTLQPTTCWGHGLSVRLGAG